MCLSGGVIIYRRAFIITLKKSAYKTERKFWNHESKEIMVRKLKRKVEKIEQIKHPSFRVYFSPPNYFQNRLAGVSYMLDPCDPCPVQIRLQLVHERPLPRPQNCFANPTEKFK